jgi:O-antigen/teichoic acid export membrane protein
MRFRLLQTFLSSGLGQLINLLSQLTLLPLLIVSWHKTVYAEWILLSTVPAYLSLSDLGFGTVLGNDLAIKAARGARSEATTIYRSAWVVVAAVSGLACGTALALIQILPFEQWLHLTALPRSTCLLVLDFLLLQVVVTQHGGVFNAALRAENLHVVGKYLNNAIAASQFFVLVAVGILRGNVVDAAFSMFLVSLFGAIAMFIASRRLVPWLRIGFTLDLTPVKPILVPGLSQNILGLGIAISLQGSLLVITTVLNPVAALAFSTARTMCRVVNMLTNMVEYAFGPEFSIAFGSTDMPLAIKLHDRASQVSIWVGSLFSVCLALAGPFLFQIWTRGRIHLDLPTFLLLLCAQIANAIYFGSWGVPIALNKQVSVAVYTLGIAILSLAIVWIGVRAMGLPGAGLASFLSEVATIGVVIPYACRLLGESTENWLKASFSTDFSWLRTRREASSIK